MTQIFYLFYPFKVPQISQIHTDFFLLPFYLIKVTQIAQMTQISYPFTFKSSHTDLTDFLPFYSFKVPQISQIHTDFFFYFFTL